MQKVSRKLQKYFFKIFLLSSANRKYLETPPITESIISADPNKLFILIIASYTADIITLHYKAIKKYLRGDYEYFVLDNNKDIAESEKIREYCAANKINYMRLPPDSVPRKWWCDGSVFHGFALNWAYHNVVLRFNPRSFGFFDGDLYPTRQIDISGYLKQGDAWGLLSDKQPLWHFWAKIYYITPALAFFRTERFAKRAPNFLPYWGVDTGGRVRVDSRAVLALPEVSELHKPQRQEVGDGIFVDTYGGFVHIGGGVHKVHELIARKRWVERRLT